MKCPRCGNPGLKAFNGFCTRVHYELEKRPKTVILNCATCSGPVRRLSSQLSNGGKVYCKRCPKNAGETHPRWKDGQYINPAGYRLILVNNEYKLEHRHTWEQANHACILPTAHGKVSIHHINTNKTDNRPENLVMLTNEAHGRIHRLMDAGKFKEAKCILISYCEQQAFFVLHSEYLEAIKKSSLPDILSGM